MGFKKHIEIRVNSATNALYLISSLFKSEWELSANAVRQLYLTCVLPIAEYDSEIWFQNQRQYIDLYQKLQNKALRKILGAFKTSPIQLMEIESNILLAKIRLM